LWAKSLVQGCVLVGTDDASQEAEPRGPEQLTPDHYRIFSICIAVIAVIFLFYGIGIGASDDTPMAIGFTGAGIGLALLAIALAIVYVGSVHEARA